MKSVIKTLGVLLVCFISFQAQAQHKIAHINTDSLVKKMPEVKKVDTLLTNAQKTYANKIQQMRDELQAKYTKYLADKPTMTPTLIEIVEKELEELQYKIQQMEQTAQQDLQQMQQDLMKPIIKQVKDAVAAAAKEGGYAYVLDTSSGVVLYSIESADLMKAVMKKLNLK